MPSPSQTGLPVTSVPLTGNRAIDALIWPTKWGGAVGTGISITYSFGEVNSVWSAYRSGTEPFVRGYAPLTADQRASVEQALGTWAAVANISFTRVTETATNVGDMRFAWSGSAAVSGIAQAYMPGRTGHAGDVWLNADRTWSPMQPGAFGFQTLVHEIGHALGMDHSFEGRVALPVEFDCYAYTIMGYSAYPGLRWSSVDFLPTTPMLYDVQAIQHLYGANMRHNAGDTRYVFEQGQRYFQTIWDGGGTDTIEWRATTEGAVIDLRAGRFSDLGRDLTYSYAGKVVEVSPWTVAIAFGAWIENAVGGGGRDSLIGNSRANVLSGGGAADKLNGMDGNDTLIGGTGRDVLIGGGGADVFVFSSVADSRPLAGADVIRDFQRGADRIDLRQIDADPTVAGNQALAFRSGPGGVWLRPDAGAVIVAADVTGDGIADLEIRVLGQQVLTASDFVF